MGKITRTQKLVANSVMEATIARLSVTPDERRWLLSEMVGPKGAQYAQEVLLSQDSSRKAEEIITSHLQKLRGSSEAK